MTALVCPHCNAAFDTTKRLVRADVTECEVCHKKFVVTQKTLQAYQNTVVEPAPPMPQAQAPVANLSKINCPHCATPLQGQISIGQIVECSGCHRQFEATAERLNNTPVLLARATPQATHEPVNQKPKSIAGKLFFIALGLVFVLPFMLPDSGNDTTTAKPAAAPVAKPEPVQDPNAPERFLSVWDGSNRELVTLIESNLKDPKSFEHVETRFIDKGDSLKLFMTFRGTNGFNAVVTNNVSADLDKSTRTLSNVQ